MFPYGQQAKRGLEHPNSKLLENKAMWETRTTLDPEDKAHTARLHKSRIFSPHGKNELLKKSFCKASGMHPSAQ
jgi:hypothetical protein